MQVLDATLFCRVRPRTRRRAAAEATRVDFSSAGVSPPAEVSPALPLPGETDEIRDLEVLSAATVESDSHLSLSEI